MVVKDKHFLQAISVLLVTLVDNGVLVQAGRAPIKMTKSLSPLSQRIGQLEILGEILGEKFK